MPLIAKEAREVQNPVVTDMRHCGDVMEKAKTRGPQGRRVRKDR